MALMTPEIALTLAITAAAVVLFVTERLRVDVVALLVLISLALTGLVTPTEALSGFSNPAVVTVWAMFVLSGSLSKTGVARLVGRQVLHLAGGGEGQLVVMIMLIGGAMSAFMNNVAVTAMMLPVVADIAHRTNRPRSKLLIPLAFGSLLGGMNTLIGTPPNLLISMALRDYGLRPFQLFDYTPVGLAVMLAGVAYMVLVGRHLLPTREWVQGSTGLKAMGRESVVLIRETQEVPRLNKAPLAVLVMGAVLLSAALGWLPIYIAAIVGVTLTVLTGCLKMEEAYRFIEWKVVFLIAGMLPLGTAMEQSGAARFLAESMIGAVDRLGPMAVLAGLFVVTALAAQIIPTHAVAVLMAPIALNIASAQGISPYASAMVVAFSTSASFLLPVGHPANVLIMGPGSYRFTDYAKVGAPLTLVVLMVVLLVVPLFWPLFP
jgi:anion transporter